MIGGRKRMKNYFLPGTSVMRLALSISRIDRRGSNGAVEWPHNRCGEDYGCPESGS
jgi:hypothetical protein